MYTPHNIHPTPTELHDAMERGRRARSLAFHEALAAFPRLFRRTPPQILIRTA